MTRAARARPVRQAPPAPADFALAAGTFATRKDVPFGMRLYASIYHLMIFASLRYCGAWRLAIAGNGFGGMWALP